MYKKLVEYDYTRKQPILSDKTPYRCRFCEEIKGPDEFKKIAHAVAECIGNKAIISSMKVNWVNCIHFTAQTEVFAKRVEGKPNCRVPTLSTVKKTRHTQKQ